MEILLALSSHFLPSPRDNPPKKFQLKISNTCNTVEVLYEASCRKENTRLQNFRKKNSPAGERGVKVIALPFTL